MGNTASKIEHHKIIIMIIYIYVAQTSISIYSVALYNIVIAAERPKGASSNIIRI